jgi:N-methylhydantoinase B
MHRGGCGTQYGIETLSDVVVSILGDRVDHAPFGVQGGGTGAPNHVRLTLNGQTSIPPMRSKAEKLLFSVGDAFHLASPGGGGFGAPLERDLELVEADLNNGLVSRTTAEEVYGVVIAKERLLMGRPIFRLDANASALRRKSLKEQTGEAA